MTKSPKSPGPTAGSHTGPSNVPPHEPIRSDDDRRIRAETDDGAKMSEPAEEIRPLQPQASIVPTIGRQVWFWPATNLLPRLEQPEAATVCFVHNEVLVNLHVLNALGEARSERSVLLCQPGVVVPDQGRYCQWMPFQVQQQQQQRLDAMGHANQQSPYDASKRRPGSPASER